MAPARDTPARHDQQHRREPDPVQRRAGQAVADRAATPRAPCANEMAHSFGLDDFYDWTPTGQCCFIMKAGSATMITEFDKWMLHDRWRLLKSRWGL